MNECSRHFIRERMKIIIIIILAIFLTSEADYMDESTSDTSTMNSFSLIRSSMKELNENETNISTYQNEKWSTDLTDLYSSTIFNEILIEKEKWFTVNQSNKGDSSEIFWRKLNDDSTYILRSDGQCIRQMCRVKLKYNGSLLKRKSGCLSFILLTQGQPVGQLWIEEDDQQESFSQKFQLTNSTLGVEHSFKSNIENLSINAKILFPNPKFDRIILSNLNINWKGSCPKDHQEISFSTILTDQSTLENDLTSEYIFERTTTYNEFEISSNNLVFQSSTIKLKIKQTSSSFINQSNILWILSLITLFCLLVILLSILYGLWTIQGHYRFIWYIPFDSPVQILARRSIRSSTRSQYQIPTLSQMENELLQIHFEEDNLTINSSRSTLSTSNQYF